MNERIKLIVKQAGLNDYINDNLWPAEQPDFNTLMEKFAELIVRECANVADRAEENGCEWIGGNILIHFGVRE